jgi:viroplasmin and RNaseH domain-containing protein
MKMTNIDFLSKREESIDFNNENDTLLMAVEPHLKNAEIGIFYGNGQQDMWQTWHWIKWKDFGHVRGEEHKKVVGYLTKDKLTELLEQL